MVALLCKNDSIKDLKSEEEHAIGSLGGEEGAVTVVDSSTICVGGATGEIVNKSTTKVHPNSPGNAFNSLNTL